MNLMAQRRDWDCGVAALAMLTRVCYEDVYAATTRVVPGKKLRTVGTQAYELQRIARQLGRRLRYVHWRKVDLELQSGVLSVNYTTQKIGHWVVLHRGSIIDPTGLEIWDSDDYFRQPHVRHGGLLTDEGKT